MPFPSTSVMAFLIESKHARIHVSAFCSDHFGLGESGAYSNDVAAASMSPLSMSTTTDFVLVVPMSHPMTQLNGRNHPKENGYYWFVPFITLFLDLQFQNRCGSSNAQGITRVMEDTLNARYC
jgi:hypothetical protein